jgi:hypothetical protein
MRKNLNKVSWLAWLWFGIMLIATLVTLPNDFASSNIQGSVLTILDIILSSVAILTFPLVGALIVSRQPQNTIGWLLMVPGLAFPLDPFIRSQIVGVTTPPAHPSIFFWLAVYLSNTTWLFAIFPVFFIALLFPTGRPLTPRWRWAVVYAIGVFVSFFSLAVFDRTLAPDASIYGVDWSIPNPLGFLDLSDTVFTIWLAGVAILTLLCVVSIILRYRRASGVQRKQINWLLYAISLFGASYIPYLIYQSWGQNFWAVFVDLFFMTIPLAIGIAILRYRLFDIDLIIRKTLQYALLTGLLALVYFGSVILLQSLAENMFGKQTPLVIVLSTLAIAALFNPLRMRVQDFIDRRFYRRKYDAEQTLAGFATTARDEVDMDKLSAALLGLIEETMQPERASLWLKSTNQPLSKAVEQERVLTGVQS